MMGLIFGLCLGYIAGSVLTGKELNNKLNNYFYEKGYSSLEAKKEAEFIFNLKD